jgi:phytoene synthase
MADHIFEDGIQRGEVERAARDLAYDDYIAALLAPRASRPALLTLAALFGELNRIPMQVSDAALGEIRLQWWRDAFARGARTGHPVADAALALQPLLPLPLSAMIEPVIEARAAELYAEPFPGEAAFEAYVTAPAMAYFNLRAALLGSSDLMADPVAGKAARTIGLVRTCARLPQLIAKGRYPLPASRFDPTAASAGEIDEQDVRIACFGLLSEAATAWTALRPELQRVKPDLRRVVLPVALAGPYLRAMQHPGHNVLRDVADPSPLERMTRLWLAARFGRF